MNTNDPRSNPNHKERGCKKFFYTYQDIANVVSLSVSRVQHLKIEGKIIPESLKSIIDYVKEVR